MRRPRLELGSCVTEERRVFRRLTLADPHRNFSVKQINVHKLLLVQRQTVSGCDQNRVLIYVLTWKSLSIWTLCSGQGIKL
jgi:hypothetical protein